MDSFSDKVEKSLSRETQDSREAADRAREKLGSNTSNPDEEPQEPKEQTLNEKLGRAHLDHNANDGKFGGND